MAKREYIQANKDWLAFLQVGALIYFSDYEFYFLPISGSYT